MGAYLFTSLVAGAPHKERKIIQNLRNLTILSVSINVGQMNIKRVSIYTGRGEVHSILYQYFIFL